MLNRISRYGLFFAAIAIAGFFATHGAAAGLAQAEATMAPTMAATMSPTEGAAPMTTPTPGNPPTPAQATGSLDTSACVGVMAPANVQVPANGNQQKFTQPDWVIDMTHLYCAIFTTEHGHFVVEMYPKYAPQNVNNFVFLAEKGFYDNIGFHRVIAGFMAQTGDPTGTGMGGPGYGNIPLEADNGLKYDSAGIVGVARTSDPNTAGSQFFITLAPADFLDGQYTIIGKVAEGLDIVNQIRIRDTDQDPNAGSITPEKLLTVRIVDIGAQQ